MPIALTLVIPVDYGVYGVLLIVGLGIIRDLDGKIIYTILLLVLNLFFIEIVPYFNIPYLITFDQRLWFSMLAIVTMFFYNGEEGPKLKYFLYVYYPLHLRIIITLTHLSSWW